MADILRWPHHLRERCRRADCEPCCAGTCIIENFYICATCGGAEGDLPTDCPSEPIPSDVRHLVMTGEVDYYANAGWVRRGHWRWRGRS